jgi:hypothetical protein
MATAIRIWFDDARNHWNWQLRKSMTVIKKGRCATAYSAFSEALTAQIINDDDPIGMISGTPPPSDRATE